MKIAGVDISLDDILKQSGFDVNRVEYTRQYYVKRWRSFKIITAVEVIICLLLLCLKFGIL